MTPTDLSALIDTLWPDGDSLAGSQVHMLLDGARDPAIAPLLRFGKLEYSCLFSGPLTDSLRAAAPYIVHLAARSDQTHEILRRAWNQHWGVLTVARADVTITQQRLHFKKLLRVQDEDGQWLAFRFYDPRVLRVFLPTCTADETARLFGPVDRLLMPTAQADAWLDFERAAQPRRVLEQTRPPAGPPAAAPVLPPAPALQAAASTLPLIAYGAALLRAPDAADRALLVREDLRAAPPGAPAPGDYDFVIAEAASSLAVGTLSVTWGPGQDGLAEPELGYWLQASARGRGLASDAVRAASAWLFTHEQVDRIVLRMHHANSASVQVAEQCGFTLERACAGVLRYTLRLSPAQRTSAAPGQAPLESRS